jgi:hypothetical protein
LPTFTQAISSTKPTAPSSHPERGANLARDSLLQRRDIGAVAFVGSGIHRGQALIDAIRSERPCST